MKVEITLDKASDWGKARIILDGAMKLQPLVQKAIVAELQFIRKKIVETFDNEGPPGAKWKPLQPMTLAVRRFEGFKGTKILQVTRDLVGSISVVAVPGEGGFVGVARSKPRKGGQDPVNVARVHEEGRSYSVTFTDRQRRYLFAALAAAGLSRTPTAGKGAPAGTHAVLIRIPPRPFLGPVFEQYARPEDVARSVQARVAAAVAGKLGRPDGGAPRE